MTSSTNSGRDKRRHERLPLCVKIRITHNSLGSVVIKTRDISDGGVYLVGDELEMLPTGSVVEGQIQDEYGERPVVKMEVVRVDSEGAGLRFLD